MEVHKHPHHVKHKKKWNEYLLEFFMLFLAVFWALLRKMSESQQRNLRFNDARLLRTKKLATELIKDIKKEYHLEDE